MNPTEIYDALDKVASAPFDPVEFPFAFAEATDNARATISKLRNGSTNKSDIAGGVLLHRKFHYAPAPLGEFEAVLDRLRASRRTAAAKPRVQALEASSGVGVVGRAILAMAMLL